MPRRRTAARPESCRALVTGGSGAIGAAICRALAADGAELIVHAGRHRERAEAVAESIRAEGGRARATAFDLADEAATADGMEELLADGPLGIVVHNAGIHADAPLAGMDSGQWQSVMEVGLNAFFRTLQPALLPMTRGGWGRVIAISSVAARLGNRGQVNYAAAKAGLHGAVFSLAREMGARGITANVIAPGMIASDMLGEVDAETLERMVPAGRVGRPEEVAALAAFLCRDQAAYINGQVIGVDGGMAPG